jgi:hypothetical protein
MPDLKPNRYLDIMLDEASEQLAGDLLGTPRKSPIWIFLNSAFGLFLLSSIVLGLFSFGYGQFVRLLERRHLADQLELEIALRIKELRRLTTGPDANRYSHVVYVSW